MLKKKRKTVLEVLRQCNDIKLSNDVICRLYRSYEGFFCEKAIITPIYNYSHLCELFSSSEFEQSFRCIIQEGNLIVDANHPTNTTNVPACYQMNPSKEALIILSRNCYGLVASIFKYVPRSFEHAVRINNLDYLRLNFHFYDVFKVEQFDSIPIDSFEKLTVEDSVIAFSREHLPYERDGKTYFFPIVLKYN